MFEKVMETYYIITVMLQDSVLFFWQRESYYELLLHNPALKAIHVAMYKL